MKRDAECSNQYLSTFRILHSTGQFVKQPIATTVKIMVKLKGISCCSDCIHFMSSAFRDLKYTLRYSGEENSEHAESRAADRKYRFFNLRRIRWVKLFNPVTQLRLLQFHSGQTDLAFTGIARLHCFFKVTQSESSRTNCFIQINNNK